LSDWNIKRKTDGCNGCNRRFEENEEYFSILYDRNAEFIREDYCLDCWPSRDREGAFSFWKTRMPTKEEETKKLVDDAVILNFFLRLENETEERKKDFRYVLALLLMRKKKLKLLNVKREEDEEILVFNCPAESRDFEVAVRNLSEEQIQQLTEQVGQILNVKL